MPSSFQYNGFTFSFVESDDFAHDFFTHAGEDPGESALDVIRSTVRAKVRLSQHHIIDGYTQSSLLTALERAARLSPTFRRAVHFSRDATSQGSVLITPLEEVRWATYRMYDSRTPPTEPPNSTYRSFWDPVQNLVNISPAPTYSEHPDVWFLWERSVIHELMHALTCSKDPEVLDPIIILGATDTIAQRILSEMNNPSYARATYHDAGYRSLRTIRNNAVEADVIARSFEALEEHQRRFSHLQVDEAHLPTWDSLPQWHTPMPQSLPGLIDSHNRLVLEGTTFPATSLRFQTDDVGLTLVLHLRTHIRNAQGVLQEATIEITYTSDYELSNAIVEDHHPNARIPFGIRVTSQAVTRFVESEDGPVTVPPTPPPRVYVLRRGYWILQPRSKNCHRMRTPLSPRDLCPRLRLPETPGAKNIFALKTQGPLTENDGATPQCRHHPPSHRP